jgi:hypothetical protein
MYYSNAGRGEMIHIGLTIFLWLTAGPAAIGHDIEVLWEKGYLHEDSSFHFGRGISAGDLNGDKYIDIAASFHYLDTVIEHRYVGGALIFLGGEVMDTLPDITIWTHEQVGGSPHILVMDINGDGVDGLLWILDVPWPMRVM